MKNLLKLLHFASLVGLAGGTVVSLVLADKIDATSPGGTAAMHAAIALIGAAVVVPSLIVMLLTGMLLVVARPHLIGQRWVWLKAALGCVVGGVVLVALQPAMNAAASMSAAGALGQAAIGSLEHVTTAEYAAACWTLGLVVAATIVAIWRPRFGRPRDNAET